MRFKNNGKTVNIRVGNLKDFYWVTAKSGQIVDLPRSIGISYGFTKVYEAEVTSGKIGKTKVETKQFKTDFKKKLMKIKGIGKKTAEDILRIYKTEKDLKKAIKEKKEIPIRDDLNKKLTRRYG